MHLMDRKKELKQQYKQMKTEMGIFVIRSKVNHKSYIEATKDLKGRINITRFKLEFGSHPNKELQKEWKEHGKGNFIIEILENLAYEEDETKTDYEEDLILLHMIWTEKLSKQGIELYNK